MKLLFRFLIPWNQSIFIFKGHTFYQFLKLITHVFIIFFKNSGIPFSGSQLKACGRDEICENWSWRETTWSGIEEGLRAVGISGVGVKASEYEEEEEEEKRSDQTAPDSAALANARTLYNA